MNNSLWVKCVSWHKKTSQNKINLLDAKLVGLSTAIYCWRKIDTDITFEGGFLKVLFKNTGIEWLIKLFLTYKIYNRDIKINNNNQNAVIFLLDVNSKSVDNTLKPIYKALKKDKLNKNIDFYCILMTKNLLKNAKNLFDEDKSVSYIFCNSKFPSIKSIVHCNHLVKTAKKNLNSKIFFWLFSVFYFSLSILPFYKKILHEYSLKYNKAIFISASDFHMSSKMVSILAKEYSNLQTVAFVHGAISITETMKPMTSDYFCVWSNFQKQLLLDIGIEESKIKVMGNPFRKSS